MINVVDSPCGSGKTQWAISYIKSLPGKTKVLFVTPFLTECERIVGSCSRKVFVQPVAKYGRGRKIDNFIDLVRSNKNIVITHALFSSITDEAVAELKSRNYVLIIDEAMTVLNKVNIYSGEQYDIDDAGDRRSATDVETLISCGLLKVLGGDEVVWDDEGALGKYDFIRRCANTGNLFMMNKNLLMWTFPRELFQEGVFSDVYVLTYQFDYQIHSYYFKYYNIQYKKFEVIKVSKRYELAEYGSHSVDKKFREEAKKLINIYSGDNLNAVGSGEDVPSTALSISWYGKNSKKISVIQNNVTNYWKNIVGAPGTERMWTCFKKNKKTMTSGVLCSRNFIAINARATNDFANKKYLCYLANRYLNPTIVQFFAKRNIHLDQDNFALAELIQWIWRSAIRNGEEIYLYIPSERMRNLLQRWLDN